MSWLRSYLLLLRWNTLRLRFMLPLFVVVQAGLAVGVIIGFAFLVPNIDSTSALYLATGGPTIGLITVGLAMAPQMLAQHKLAGSFDFDRLLPVPRLAALAADMTIWILGSLPGIVLALVVAGLRFDLDFTISPLVGPAFLLVALTATALGYGLAHALPPMAATLLTQVLVFFTLLFSPINFPADRLPDWLRVAHEWLPVQYMAQAIRETLVVPVDGVSPTPYAVLAVWCAAGLVLTHRLMSVRA